MKNLMLQMQLMKHYFIATALVFTVGVILGAQFSEQFQAFIEMQLKGLERLTQSIADKPNQQWSLFWLIFLNNTIKSILIIALGAVFGIMPLFFLMANGIILGYVGAAAAQKESLWYLFKAIVPHGIIEIPAIIFACAFGLRFGVLMLKTVISLIRPGRSVTVKEELRGFAKALVPVAVILIITLFTAAVIESTFTYWLVKG